MAGEGQIAPGTATRRRLLTGAGAVGAAALAAPHVRRAHAAGRLALGLSDDGVAGVNATLGKLCREWGEANAVEVQIDRLTSLGDKDRLTAGAAALAGAGHDIMTHPTWQIAVHRARLEPLDDVMAAVADEAGAADAITRYLARHDGHWYGVPATMGRQVQPCCSRLDLYRQHCGLDLQTLFTASDDRRQRLAETWTWDLYVSTAETLRQAGCAIGNPLGRTSDAVDWVGALFCSYGVVPVDGTDTITIRSDATRQALDCARRLAAQMPQETYAWDSAGSNDWLISGNGAGAINPRAAAAALAKRGAPAAAERFWTHPMPRGPSGRFVGHRPVFYGLWRFSRNKPAAKDLIRFLAGQQLSRQRVEDPPLSRQGTADSDRWQGGERLSIAGLPARPDVAAQIYNAALMVRMVAKVAAGGEPIEAVIAWAEGELEVYLAA